MFFMALLAACSGPDAVTPTDGGKDGFTDPDFVPIEYVDSGLIDSGTSGDTDTNVTDTESPIDTGSPVIPGTDISGRTYVFSPTLLNQIRPAGVTVTFSSSIYMMEVLADHGATLDVRFGVWDYFGTSNSQDLCSETLDVIGADFSADPILAIGPLDAITYLGGTPYPMEQLTAQIRFNGSYDAIPSAAMEMMMDTEPLSMLAYGIPSTYCAYLSGFGIPCSSCPSGAPYCIQWRTSNGTGVWDPTQTVTARSAADIAADPSCP